MKIEIFKRILLYYSDQTYQFTDSGFRVALPSKTSKVLIVARKHYIEREITLPITIMKDVKAALSFEIEQLKDGFFVFSKILTSKNGQTTIILWQVPKKIIPAGIIQIIPETFLLSYFISNNQILSYSPINDDESGILIKKGDSFTSITSDIQPLAIFAQANGVEQTQIVELSSVLFSDKIIEMYKRSLLTSITKFWLSPKKEGRNLIEAYKAYILPMFLFSSLYLGISSLFVYNQYQNVANITEKQSSEITTVLNLQDDLRKLNGEIEKYRDFKGEPIPLWKVWKIISPLYKDGVTFKFIRYNGNEFFLNATADSSTKVLEYLLDSDDVKSPSFTTSVKKNKNKETFTLKFSLKEGKKESINEK